MASLCNRNPALRPPAAFPAKKPVVAGDILQLPPAILRTRPRFLAARSCTVIPKAIQSQKHVYPDPIPEFAAAVRPQNVLFLKKKLIEDCILFSPVLHMFVVSV